jgi:hypothetical protein
MNTINTILLLTLLLSVLSIHSMKRSFYGCCIMQEPTSDIIDSPLLLLPDDMLNLVFSFCCEHNKESAENILKSMETFIQLGFVSKRFKALLSYQAIGKLCTHYSQSDKKEALKRIHVNDRTFALMHNNEVKRHMHINKETFTFIRIPSLLLIYAGVDTNIEIAGSSLLAKAVYHNDNEFIELLFKHHANPNIKNCCYHPLFTDIKSADIARMFLNHKHFNLNATDAYGRNAFWTLMDHKYPSDLITLYLEHGLDATELCPSNKNCLLHTFAEQINSKKIKNINDFLQKADILIKAIPHLINTINFYDKTPLDVAQKSFKKATKYKHRSDYTPEAFEQLIVLFRERGFLTAQEIKENQAKQHIQDDTQ